MVRSPNPPRFKTPQVKNTEDAGKIIRAKIDHLRGLFRKQEDILRVHVTPASNRAWEANSKEIDAAKASLSKDLGAENVSKLLQR
jgi:hypothetical protein